MADSAVLFPLARKYRSVMVDNRPTLFGDEGHGRRAAYDGQAVPLGIGPPHICGSKCLPLGGEGRPSVKVR
jgi:hypothetical protein